METRKLQESIAGGKEERFSYDIELGDKVIVKKTNRHEMEPYEAIFSDNPEDPRH